MKSIMVCDYTSDQREIKAYEALSKAAKLAKTDEAIGNTLEIRFSRSCRPNDAKPITV